MTHAHQNKAVKKQQPVFKPEAPMRAVHKGRPRRGKPLIGPRQKGGVVTAKNPSVGTVCSRCAKSPVHDCQRCLASGAQPEMPLAMSMENDSITSQRECANLPRSEQFSKTSRTHFFLGVVKEDKKLWVVDVLLNKMPTEFNIDTGGEVTVIS